MNKPRQAPKSAEQRDALNESEKKASQQPGSYKEDATADKVVEVHPIDHKDSAIKGIDPK